MKKSSKTLIPILAAILILCFCLVGCRSGFTVKFQTDGGTPVASQKVAKGEKAEKPAAKKTAAKKPAAKKTAAKKPAAKKTTKPKKEA